MPSKGGLLCRPARWWGVYVYYYRKVMVFLWRKMAFEIANLMVIVIIDQITAFLTVVVRKLWQ